LPDIAYCQFKDVSPAIARVVAPQVTVFFPSTALQVSLNLMFLPSIFSNAFTVFVRRCCSSEARSRFRRPHIFKDALLFQFACSASPLPLRSSLPSSTFPAHHLSWFCSPLALSVQHDFIRLTLQQSVQISSPDVLFIAPRYLLLEMHTDVRCPAH